MTTSSSIQSPLKRRFARLLLALASSAAVLLGIELCFRIHAEFAEWRRFKDWEEVRSNNVRSAGPDGRLGLGHIIQPSEHPGVIYELKPDLDLENVFGARLKTNSRGLRGPDYPPGEHPGIFRIVTIGDSYMFGQGVHDGECTVRIMEQALRRARPSMEIQVVNLAVPGFNAAMEVELLARKGLAYRPDLVLIDFVFNDFDLPNFLWAEEDFWTLDRSLAYDWFRDRVPWRDAAIGPFERPVVVEGRFPHARGEVRPEYRYMIGEDGYRTAIRRLKQLAGEHAFKVVMTSHYDEHPVLHEMAEECGFPLWRASEVLTRIPGEERRMTPEEYRNSTLVLSKDDLHPTAAGHRLAGEYYAERLLANWQDLAR